MISTISPRRLAIGQVIAFVGLFPWRGGEAQEQRTLWASGTPAAAELTTPEPGAVAVPDSVRVRHGYHQWRGAGIGAAIGGTLGALAGAIAGGITSCDDCSRQPTAGNGALYGGLAGIGVGGVLGFLVGLSSPRYVWVPRAKAPPSDPSVGSGP